jgi:hypothetical protein
MKLTQSIACAVLAGAVFAAPVLISNSYVGLDLGVGAAFAKGNGGGNGGGGNGGNGGGSGKGGGASAGSNAGGSAGKSATAGSNGRSSNAQAASTNFNGGSLGKSQTAKTNFNSLETNKHNKLVGQARRSWVKDYASNMKGLNAHRAAAQAYANADINSQVGAISAYALAEDALRGLEADRLAALNTLTGMEEGQLGLTDTELQALRDADLANSDLDLTAAEIQTALGVTAEEAAAIEAAYGNLVSAESQLPGAQQTADDAWGAAARQGQDDALRDVLNERLEERGFLREAIQ